MKLDKELQKSIDSLRWKIDTFFVIAIVLAVAALGIYISHLIFSSEINDFFEDEGTDIVNGFTVLLASISGILFVYIAFLGQQWQLIYQQQELRENRKEMKESLVQSSIQAEALTEQIKKMDRDFVHQNFFRILEQHFSTRDRVEYKYYTSKQDKKSGEGEVAFEYFFEKVTLWVDNTVSGWNLVKDDKEKEKFLEENGYPWEDRPSGLNNIKDAKYYKFADRSDVIKKINKTKITFIIKAITQEEGLGKYLRSCYYLFEYMKENSLAQYLDAVEAGMDKYERIFLFYQMTTRFEGDGRLDLLAWLIENRFLANVKPKHLLHSSHKDLLYQTIVDPRSLNFTYPHP